MLQQIDIANVLFIDIETVSVSPKIDDLPEVMRDLWKYKAAQIERKPADTFEEGELAEVFENRAAIYAEFGKVICISVGAVHRDKEDGKLRIRLKSFASRDEAEVLRDFAELLSQHYNDTNKFYVCGHNIKEFDIPYVCRRMVVNNIPSVRPLDISGKKPWETKHLIDTMELWKFGDRKSYTSLKMLAGLLGFPSPKDDIDGSDVGRVFWQEDDLDRIALYCEKDVLATAQLFLRFRLDPLFEADQVSHV